MRNPYLSLLRTSWRYAKKDRKKLLVIYGMFLCANIILSLNPLLLGWFVGKAQKDTTHIFTYAGVYVGGYFLLKLAQWCLHGPARVMERTLAFNMSRNFMEEKYHQTLHLTAKWHQDNHSGATINRIGKAYGALRGFFDAGFNYISTFSKFIFSVTAILLFSPLFGSIAVGLGILTVCIIARFDKSFIKTLSDVNEKEHQVNSNLFDSLSNIRTVITLRLEASMEKGLMGKLVTMVRPYRKNSVVNEWKWFVADMMVTLIYCVIVLGFVYQHWVPGTVFYVAGLVTLLGYVGQFTSVFQSVAGQYTDLVQFNTHIEGAAHITAEYNKKHRGDAPLALPAKWQSLHIRQLDFSYKTTHERQHKTHHLHNLDIHIKRGSKIALIGESGSGKSTLMTLLRGLYMPDKEADITVDGRPYSLETIHESTTLFPQEPEIFENTIDYNITLGLPCSREELARVCEIAHFNEVVREMPQGLQTDIREKGVNLSGGQKQRLALARGILAAKDSELILLDEPTSSIDPGTECRIYERLFAAFRDKAVISSIHRLHLLENFDYIYILDKGKITDEGSYNELLEHSERFRAMLNYQKMHAVRKVAV